MTPPFRLTSLSSLLLCLLSIVGILAILAALVVSLRLIPPDRLSIAAGSQGSAYYEIAKRYQAILAKDDIHLDIIETAGSIVNRDLMDQQDSEIDIALIQGGVISNNDSLNALAAVFPEALLLFKKTGSNIDGNPFSWLGKKVAFGEVGSGTQEVVKHLARLTETPLLDADISQEKRMIGGQNAANALLNGDLDAAFFVAPLNAPYLRALYFDQRVQLEPLLHSQSLASQLGDAHYVELFSGAIDYQTPYPTESRPLIALVTKLVAKDNLHPALVNRLIHAVKKVHGERVTLVMSEPFPNTELLDMPVDVYAAKLLREGFNPLEKTLPYWIVAQINRFALLLLPIIFLLLPLFKLLPALLAWRMHKRVYRYYDRLHEIDLEISLNQDPPISEQKRDNLARQLNEIEAGLRSESLPQKYREIAYRAIQHVELVRSRL